MYLDLNETKLTSVKWSGLIAPICTIGKAPFMAKVEIEFTPGKKILEYIEFETAIYKLNGVEMIIEEIPSVIINKIIPELDAINLSITVTAETPVHNTVTVNLTV